MTHIGIIAALPAELAPLIQDWPITDGVSTGQLQLPDGTTAAIHATAAGMGAAAATRAFAQLTAAVLHLDAVVSYGWAGALTCAIKPPDAFQVSEVIDSRTGEHFPTASAPSLIRLVTLDHVARDNEKRPLAERYQAVLVDMEAATIARLAHAHSIPFLCLKAISDGYTDILPDFNRFLDPQGQLRLPAFIAHALLRPRYWPPLVRLGKNSKQAAQKLAVALPACLTAPALLSCPS
jgi:adenosylhomocysteine nucleosidase